LNYFEKHQKYHNILNESYDNNSDTNLSKLDFLKLRVFSNGKSSHSNLVKISFCQTEKFFLQSIPQNLREQYLNDVSPCYSKYKVKLSYVDVKYCEFQKSKLLGCIIHKIKSKHPYSLIRLSDGEGYFFTNDFSKISFNESDARNRERHWWGFEQSTMIREAVIRGGIDSIKNADILGIPTIYRFLRDISNNSKSFYDNTQARGVMSVLIGIKNFNLNSIEFTDSFVNRSVFSSVEVLQQLAAISTKVVIVSGAKYNAIKNLFENKCDFKIIEIPTHAKQVGNAKYCVDDFPLPYFVEDIKAKVHAETSPGTLVLVGAGIAGKCFINAAKESGGVGLDLGSVFDSLSQAGFEALF
jgi:hypothetical protein